MPSTSIRLASVDSVPDASPRLLQVFLLDDHEIVRRGLRDLLERTGDMEVIGEAATASEALQRIPTAWPDIALLDVRLPDGNGVEVCRELIALRPQLRCLMLTAFDDDRALINAILAGAMGYVLKEIRGGILLNSIRRVANGTSLIDPHAAARVIERLQNPSPEDPRLSGLSPQERRILALLAESLTNRQIANRMFLAEKTVKNYVSHLLLKLDMRGRTEAAVFAARLGA